jgi:hypothetical protein
MSKISKSTEKIELSQLIINYYEVIKWVLPSNKATNKEN